MPVILFPPQRLQKQICDLASELTRQAAWWCAAHKDLQSQINALVKDNEELREELQALKQQGVDSDKSPVASTPSRGAANTMVQQVFCLTKIMAHEGQSSPL